MLGRRDSAVAEQLERCLSGDAEPEGPEISGLMMAAAALAPRRPISEAGRQRAFAAVMREVDRRARPIAGTHTEDLAEPGTHVRVAQAGPNLRLRVADIEQIDDERLEEIAASIATRLGQNAPDRNQ
ncbi:hypothetical protein ACFUJY_29125 [Streptomyces sp. NPDC057249]|uniref:hypothetical protein n=1 Tax=Streptomyces sp. NPDC057249 TaxID=3346067 RepID=UPI0036385EA6